MKYPIRLDHRNRNLHPSGHNLWSVFYCFQAKTKENNWRLSFLYSKSFSEHTPHIFICLPIPDKIWHMSQKRCTAFSSNPCSSLSISSTKYSWNNMLLTAFLCFVVAANKAEIVLLIAVEQYITDHLKIPRRFLTTDYHTVQELTKHSNRSNFSVGVFFFYEGRELSWKKWHNSVSVSLKYMLKCFTGLGPYLSTLCAIRPQGPKISMVRDVFIFLQIRT